MRTDNKIARRQKKSLKSGLRVMKAIFRGGSFLFLCIFLLPIQSWSAQKRFVLELDDMVLGGRHRGPSTIFLKRTLGQQYPRVDISELELKKVILVAKTKRGRGVAQLRVGRQKSNHYIVDGNSAEFNSPRKHTFDKVRIDNSAYRNMGRWQLDLDGLFKVRKVILVVKDHERRHHTKPQSVQPVFHKPQPHYSVGHHPKPNHPVAQMRPRHERNVPHYYFR